MSRREALLSAGAVFLVALVVRAWAATQMTFPRPEDVAYYVGVARNLLEGRGLTSDAIWSFGTPPLSFPRPAFEVWLPLPSVLAAIPMAMFGTTFAAAQVSSVLVGSMVAVLGWRVAADVAVARGLTPGRARTLALGTGFTAAVYLPLVLASVQPDSTMLFAFFALAACLVMSTIEREARDDGGPRASRMLLLLALGAFIGLAALTRNEAIWLGLTWAMVALSMVRRWPSRLRPWLALVVPPAVVAVVVFVPWAVRDWVEFGSPFPGQALTNALSLDGRDIFAWHDRPTVSRYFGAGFGKLLELRWVGTVHNLTQVLLYLGVPLSLVGLIGLPWVARGGIGGVAAAPGHATAMRAWSVDPLRPLVAFSILTFLVASLVFPVSTTWGTFLHAAGAIHVLLVISALLVLDRWILWVGARRGWTNPVAWLGPAFAIAGCLLFSAVLLPADGHGARAAAERYAALAGAFADPGSGLELAAQSGPVITDFPIWFAEATRHHTLALPNESPESILDLARSFDPPARLLVVDAANGGVWPAAILNGDPGAECFVPLDLPVDGVLAFRIRCP